MLLVVKLHRTIIVGDRECQSQRKEMGYHQRDATVVDKGPRGGLSSEGFLQTSFDSKNFKHAWPAALRFIGRQNALRSRTKVQARLQCHASSAPFFIILLTSTNCQSFERTKYTRYMPSSSSYIFSADVRTAIGTRHVHVCHQQACGSDLVDQIPACTVRQLDEIHEAITSIRPQGNERPCSDTMNTLSRFVVPQTHSPQRQPHRRRPTSFVTRGCPP